MTQAIILAEEMHGRSKLEKATPLTRSVLQESAARVLSIKPKRQGQGEREQQLSTRNNEKGLGVAAGSNKASALHGSQIGVVNGTLQTKFTVKGF